MPANAADRLGDRLGPGPHRDYNAFAAELAWDAEHYGWKLIAKREKLIRGGLAARDEAAAPVIGKTHRPGRVEPDTIHGRYETEVDGRAMVVDYEPDAGRRTGTERSRGPADSDTATVGNPRWDPR